MVEKGENALVDRQFGVSGLGPAVENGGAVRFVIVKGLRPSEPKELDEARGQITSDYQESLESRWLDSLKEKYPVTVNRELLAEIKPL